MFNPADVGLLKSIISDTILALFRIVDVSYSAVLSFQ